MNNLKAMIEKKRKEQEELAGGAGKKFVKRSEVEAAKLAKLREEEEQERQAKVRGGGLFIWVHLLSLNLTSCYSSLDL
jgi:hypothetical protein